MNFRKIKKNSLPELISEYIKDMIANGELQPGDKLPSEREVAEQFGVSRPSVREALHALAFAGILEIRSGSGTYLTSGDMILNKNVNMSAMFYRYTSMELVEVRKIIEVESVELAVIRATEEELEEILAASIETLKYKGTGKPYVKADIKFHTAVSRATHNGFLIQMHDIVRGMEKDPMYYHMTQAPGMIEAANFHKEAADAMCARDVETAKRAMTKHFELMEATIKYFIE